MNYVLTGGAPAAGLLKWILFFTCATRICVGLTKWKNEKVEWRWLWPLYIFMAGAGVLSFVASRDIAVTLMKEFVFSVGVFAALVGVQDPQTAPRYWRKWIVTVVAVVGILSMPFLVIGHANYISGAFQGILVHPQTYGIYIVPVAIYMTVYLIQKGIVVGWVPMLVLWLWVSVLLSASRTAVLAATLALLITWLGEIISGRIAVSEEKARALLLASVVLGVIIVGVIVTQGDTVVSSMARFAQKSDDTNRDLLSSRDSQINGLVASIKDNPIVGVGFGMSPISEDLYTERDTLTGLTVSASTEQGYLPLAVMTQVGVIGSVLFVIFLLGVIVSALSGTSTPVKAMFWAALFLNLGEMIFFSFGGIGQQMWLIVGVAVADREVRV